MEKLCCKDAEEKVNTKLARVLFPNAWKNTNSNTQVALLYSRICKA